MNDRVAALLALCIVGILACAGLGVAVPALGGTGDAARAAWEASRWAGDKMWDLVLILTGGKLALTYNANGKTPIAPGPTERTTVTPSGSAVA